MRNKIASFLTGLNQAAEGIVLLCVIFAAGVGLNDLIPKDIFFTNVFAWSFLVYICFFNEKTTIIGKWTQKNKD